MYATDSSTTRDVLAHHVWPALPEVVGAARAVMSDIADEHGFDGFVLAMVASELVTNAIRHAGGAAIELWVSMDVKGVSVAVVDQMPLALPDLTAVAQADCDAENGRGLAIITGMCGATLEAYAIRGGTFKVVSAMLDRTTLAPSS